MLNLSSLSTQSLASCVNYFCLELFTVFFQHENRFRYKFFDIVQFSRSCTPQPCGWRLDYFTTEAVFCQALFWEAFELFWTWSASGFSVSAGTFQRLLVLFKGFLLRLQKSFFCLSAWRSSIIPHPGNLVNTFWHLFSNFFAVGGGGKTPTATNPLRHRCAMPDSPFCHLRWHFPPAGGNLSSRGELYWRWSEDAQKLPLSGELARSAWEGSALYYYII